MTTHIKGLPLCSDRLQADVHYMPCKINLDGAAKVSSYFKPYIVKREDGELQASFRGYPLNGCVISLPKGYRGLVLQEALKREVEGVERNLHVTHEFDSLTFWNWDRSPSRNDPFITAFDWLDVSEAFGFAPLTSFIAHEKANDTVAGGVTFIEATTVQETSFFLPKCECEMWTKDKTFVNQFSSVP